MLTAKQIILVCKDVEKQIKAKKLVPKMREYARVLGSVMMSEMTDLQDVMKNEAARCEVCVRGALIMSKAGLYNNCPIKKNYWEVQESTSDVAERFSKESFPMKVWARAEYAFEGLKPNSNHFCYDAKIALTTKEKEACYAFYKRHAGRSKVAVKARLLAIVRNIIRNKGKEFRPRGL